MGHCIQNCVIKRIIDTLLQRNYKNMTILSSVSYNSSVKYWKPQRDHMALHTNLSFNEMCYKWTVLYFFE